MKYFIPLFILLAVSACATKNGSSAQVVEEEKEAVSQGMPFTDLDVATFVKQAQADSDAVLLDVRTPGETAEGMIPGAIEIDFQAADFEKRIQQLDKSKTYYVYCRSGGRSVGACDVMAKNGFEHLYNMLGGYNAYKNMDK